MDTRIFHLDVINQAAKAIQGGKLVAFPTETVYGLGGNALDEAAVIKIFEAKERPHFDPLIIHLASFSECPRYVKEVPDVFYHIAEEYCPGPITFLLRKKAIISDLVTSGSDFVAVRIPDHAMTLALLRQLDFPLAAPSANPFGYISPTTAQHVEDQLGDKINYILDGGPCGVGLESTIIGLDEENDAIVVYRKGGLEIADLEKFGKEIKVLDISNSRPSAPGMLLSHYAPKKKIYLGNLESLYYAFINDAVSVLAFQNQIPDLDLSCQLVLSPSGDLREAARNLFDYLRQLDNDKNTSVIIAELVPEMGLGLAINDRLKRAAYRIPMGS